MNWSRYQEETAEFFRSLGLEAATNVTVNGVRTSHDVDVLVKSHHVGFDINWIVECKRWATPVSKLHVLALREIVSDIGADRGILLAENGFQSGAIEAAAMTNVRVSSLAEVTVAANREILAMRLRDFFDRTTRCRKEYWDIPKSARIDHGLRPDVPEVGYSGDWAIKAAEDLIMKGLRGSYPVLPDEVHLKIGPDILDLALPKSIASQSDLIAIVDRIVTRLENKLSAYKAYVTAQ